MSNTFFVSDTHFGHAGIITFKDKDDKPLRPFSSVEEMDELMVENWNNTVSDKDRIYHLGDVVMNRRCLTILGRLNGRKILIKGNHDIFKLKDYTPYFEDIRAYRIYPKYGLICSHIPIYADQMGDKGRWKYNVHGHLHSNHVMKRFKAPFGEAVIKKEGGYWDEDGNYGWPDERYLNICVEQTNYTPISFDEILERLKCPKLQPKKNIIKP